MTPSEYRRPAIGYSLALGSFALGAAIASVLAGAAFGLIGSFLPESARVVLGFFVAILGITLAAKTWARSGLPLLQRNCETPKGLVSKGPVRWGLWGLPTGALLGLGFPTRIGFALWYVVPAACLLSGSWAFGIGVYATYGVGRALATVVLASLVMGKRLRSIQLDYWLIDQWPRARIICDVGLLIFSIAAVVAFGW